MTALFDSGWECPPTEVGQKKKWVFFSKGGEFELFYQPLVTAAQEV